MTSRREMRAARLHGVRDLRVESVPVPEPGPGELLVRVEACGVCPTDIRKYLLGLRGDAYPLNPGHEWVGHVEAIGDGLSEWAPGRRVYGDTYAGYAEYALLATSPSEWSYGALELPEELPRERAIFVEPLADCLHAIRDQAQVRNGEQVVVLGAGQMGLQIVLVAAAAGARVVVVDPLPGRQALARSFGAAEAIGEEAWAGAECAADAVIVTVGDDALVRQAIEVARPGGRVVLFAGFGERSEAVLDLDRLHYHEIALVGSEWIGAPPNQRRERYDDALELLVSGAAPLEQLVSARCGLDEIEEAFEAQRTHRTLKTIVVP
jgi:L-iditol 2-dehydrogenase